MSTRTHSLRIRRPRFLFPVVPAALLALGISAADGEAATSAPFTPHLQGGSALLTTASFPALATPDTGEAERIEAQADALKDRVDRRARAARLYRQAADLRPADDPQRVTNLRHASRMNYYAGRTAAAIRDAHDASQAALRQGDLMEAAHAYLDAAWLAAGEGQGERAEAWIEEARLLASSPLLAVAQQEEILGRMRDST